MQVLPLLTPLASNRPFVFVCFSLMDRSEGTAGDSGMAAWMRCLRTHNKRKRQKTAFTDSVHGRFSCCEENLEAAARSPDACRTYVTALKERTKTCQNLEISLVSLGHSNSDVPGWSTSGEGEEVRVEGVNSYRDLSSGKYLRDFRTSTLNSAQTQNICHLLHLQKAEILFILRRFS